VRFREAAMTQQGIIEFTHGFTQALRRFIALARGHAPAVDARPNYSLGHLKAD